MADMCTPFYVCPILMTGTTLTCIDFYFDAGFALGMLTNKPVLSYYLWVLRPAWKPVPWPGFFIVAGCFVPLLTKCLVLSTALGM